MWDQKPVENQLPPQYRLNTKSIGNTQYYSVHFPCDSVLCFGDTPVAVLLMHRLRFMKFQLHLRFHPSENDGLGFVFATSVSWKLGVLSWCIQ